MKVHHYSKALSWITRPRVTETATAETYTPELERMNFKPEKSKADQYKEYLKAEPFLEPESQIYARDQLGFDEGGSAQLVQPGQPGVRQGYAPKSQKVRKLETRRTVSLKPHEVTIYRKAVEIRAKKRDLRVPDWDNYPGRGYPSDYTPGQTISKDVGRMIKAGKLETVGTGSGAGQAETLLSKVDQDKIKKRFGSKFEG